MSFVSYTHDEMETNTKPWPSVRELKEKLTDRDADDMIDIITTELTFFGFF